MSKKFSHVRGLAPLFVLACAGMAATVRAQIPASERQALIDLYNSTNGAGWTNSTNWGGPVGTECNWFGVICDGSPRTVHGLELQANNLAGVLPATLGDLSNLQGLILFRNKLNGPIPPELGKTGLRDLQLWDNELSGPIPLQLFQLANLTSLILYKNNLTGSIPPDVGNLRMLQDLELSWNQLSGPIPAEIGNLASLEGLGLVCNQLTGPIPSTLGRLSKLQILALQANHLTGSIPVELGQLLNLQYLVLESNELTGSIPAELGHLAKLQTFIAASNQLTGPIPPELGNTSLQDLELYGNGLTGPIPPELGNLTNLRTLDLRSNRLSGPIPPDLGKLVRLQLLFLDRNQLVGEVPRTITNLTDFPVGLWNFDISYNGLYSQDPAVMSYLNDRMNDAWQQLQTVPVTGLAFDVKADAPVTLTWSPIVYRWDAGGYQVFWSTTSGGPYALFGVTADKAATGFPMSGLAAGQTYYFIVKSVTYPNSINQNTVVSDPSAEIHTTAGGQACTLPSVTSQPQSQSVSTGQTASLSVAATGTAPLSYQWYQGESGDTSTAVGTGAGDFVTPALTATTSYWVRVSNGCGQADSVTATVTVNSVPASQRQALLDLYTSTGGATWTTSTNWNGAAGTECTWFGVTCDSAGTQLRSLDLRGNNLAGRLPATIGNLTALQNLWLSSNRLTGEVPGAVTVLTALVAGASDIRWNGLHSSDPAVVTFLDTAQSGGDWQSTQTVPVTGLVAGAVTPSSVTLSWTPIAYTADGGGYRVYYAGSPGGPYTLAVSTPDKSAAGLIVTGLADTFTYYFVVRSVTDANPNNPSAVVSDASAEVSARTVAVVHRLLRRKP